MLRSTAVAVALAAAALAGCTKVDDTLGGNLIPDDQHMKAGYVSLSARLANGELNPKKYVETRLYRTDSLLASNISYGYIGSMLSDTFGLRTAGFLTQMVGFPLEEGYFGQRPIFDSAIILFTVSEHGADTLTPQVYNVYEVVSNDYLTEKEKKDTAFYLNFIEEVDKYIGRDVLFTFTFPDGEKTGPSSSYATLHPQPAGLEYIRELMLQSGKYKEDYSIYSTDSLKQWVEDFKGKGIYIRPADDQQQPGKGTIYALELESSGLAIYGRTRNADDPTLIQDTIGLVYAFYDKETEGYGHVSVNTVRHDYSLSTSPARITPEEAEAAKETNDERPLTERAYVEGMGGIATEITFSKDFFEELEAVREKENAESGKHFTTMAFSQARMSLYFSGSAYDWNELVDVPHMIDEMDKSQSRLGLYTDYKLLKGIADYAYAYEKSYGNVTLAYGGYINRSRGCYVMDITAHVQQMWNSYIQAKERAGGDPERIDWDQVEGRTIYLGPEAYGMYTSAYSVVQGMAGDDAATFNAPVRFDIAYNLVK